MPFLVKLKSFCGALQRFFISPDEHIRRKRRLVIGVCVLLLVNVLWVASAELSSYIFKGEGYNKPFFTTYFKTSAFTLYLVGFLFYHPWQYQCQLCLKRKASTINQNRTFRVHPGNGVRNTENSSLLASPHSSQSSSPGLTAQQQYLTDSVFEPITDEEIYQANNTLNNTESCNEERHVHFNSYREVRHLQGDEAAQLARMSHAVSEQLQHIEDKLSISKVMKIAVLFCLLWFLATWGYQEALNDTSPAAVNILSSSSGLFTLILAAVFQSSAADKLTLSKGIAVILSICGITMVTLSDAKSTKGGINYGAIWALGSAFLYASYLVFLKKKVPDESKIDIPMFFGFVGLFNLLFLWPGFFILHYTNIEPFKLPPKLDVWGYLALNAVFGTALSEFLWLWGCFLTSSLTATLSLSLVIPLTMITDIFMNRIKFEWLFLVGTIPVVLSFFAVSTLTHYPDWDPAMDCIKKCIKLVRWTDTINNQLEGEQRESLIASETADQRDASNQVST